MRYLVLLVFVGCSGVYFRSPVTFENELEILNRMHRETQAELKLLECEKLEKKKCNCDL